MKRETIVMNKFLIGCCYYPEHWERSAMKSDLCRIKDLGFNCIRMGEFSWSLYEREEGKYDFSILAEAVGYADELGLDVILGTPTAAPPKWLIDKHPEVLARTKDGIVMQHGSRQHHNHTSEIYLSYCAAITEAMVKSFCEFKNVIGWQIDNELNCHRKESYAKSDDIAFRKWLENKYGTIEILNESWGCRFWSLEFNSFDQVHCPARHPTYENPSWITDYYLFMSDTVVNYTSVQTKIIRKYMPRAFITHNGYFQNIDYKRLSAECLDFLSFDSYPEFQERNGRAEGRCMAYRLAQTRSCSEKYMVLEQQSGPGGQISYLLPTPLPGQIRLWTYQDIAHGAVGVLYFRYRTALFGAEQLWYGIYDHDVEENYRSREIKETAGELLRIGNIFLENRAKREVGIYYDYHNVCADKAESFVKSDERFIFDSLNKKNVAEIVEKLHGGALVIEKASRLKRKTIEDLCEVMEGQTGELLVVLEDERKPIERLMNEFPNFAKKFNSRIDLPVFINDELVTFGQTYAKENGYKIDEMGILALYSDIDILQREEKVVTVADVKAIIDDAIENANRTTLKKLVKKLVGKNKDESDRIILKEEDFR